MSTQESLKILQMIEQGQISAEEGIRLLNASEGDATPEAAAPAPEPVIASAVPEPAPAPDSAETPVSGAAPLKGWLRVRVTDIATNRSKVSVNLPLGLMAAGMKIGSHFAPELNNVNLAEVLSEIKSTAPGKIIDVMDDEDGEHVEIFVE
jgi:hypothetical protein